MVRYCFSRGDGQRTDTPQETIDFIYSIIANFRKPKTAAEEAQIRVKMRSAFNYARTREPHVKAS